MRTSLVTACLLLGAFMGSAQAEEACGKKPIEMNSIELFECNTRITEQVERKLRKAYEHALRSQRDPRLKSELAAAQKAWERYRERQCKYQLDSMGEATEGPSWFQGCMQDMAKERMKWL